MADLAKTTVEGNELWWLREGPGGHGSAALTPEEVTRSLEGSFSFVSETASTSGLWAPQIGALHAILAHRTMETAEPITVVMPTGTGKTETMLAAYSVAPRTTLVVVPSDTLRAQIAGKFATLGILPGVHAVAGDFRCPVVLVLKSALSSAEQVTELVRKANVMVATAQVLAGFTDAARSELAEMCERLFVDEAHHVAARTWRSVTEMFSGKEVVQFTATPYREDGQHLGGQVAYAYPLRLAQQNGYFARINYRSVVDLVDPDRAVASAAVTQLRQDLDAGLNHILMARVGSIARAKEIIQLYEELAPDLHPMRLDTSYAESTRRKQQQELIDGESRVVVCVNMLGEGFDLPSLKVAAIHDPQKSLAVTLQFIGRFTRVAGERLGEASAFVPLQTAGIDDRLRKLYGEDTDWNEVIEDLTEREVGREKERSEFELGFGSLPREVALRSIRPKMSTVTYTSPEALRWEPEKLYELFEDRLLTTRLGINNKDKVVWWVSQEARPVRWGDIETFSELVHHLYLVHVDPTGRYLYVNSSDNASLHEEVAKAVGGENVRLIKGEQVYRVLARVKRRVPTNVGLLDAVSRTRRFSMHVGQDVLHAWRGEGGTKMKTNIFAHGFAESRTVSFGASRKGRVWSHEEAHDIHDWVRWARNVGPTLTDETISLESVMSGFLLPEPAVERPRYVPLAIEWPHEIIATLSERRQLTHNDVAFPLIDTELRLKTHASDGPLGFEVVTPTWCLEYEYEFRDNEPPLIRAVSEDARIFTPTSSASLADFMTQHGLLLTFESEIVLMEQGFLLRPNREQRLFPKDDIETFDWTDVDITRESQGPERDPSTIQHRTIQTVSSEEDWEVVIDDDGTGELADVVCMKRDEEYLDLLLLHCKYSSKPTPGARIDDLYDVCGQAVKMNRAKSFPELLTRRLLRRETDRQVRGKSGLIIGTPETLTTIVGEARFRKLRVTIAIVQPGMAKHAASDDMRALLGGTERFLEDTYGMRLRVVGSA